MSQELSADLKLFCPRKDCPYWHDLENKIIKDGVYVTKKDLQPRQMFKCCHGEHRFRNELQRIIWQTRQL